MKRIKKKSQRSGCLYIQNIPLDLKSYFKAYCAMQGKTMSEVIKEYMQQSVQDSRKGEDNKAQASEHAAEGDKPKNSPRKSIDHMTIELLEEGPKTLEELHEELWELCKKLPNKNKGTLLNTTKRRLHGYLQDKYSVKIIKTKSGRYYIE